MEQTPVTIDKTSAGPKINNIEYCARALEFEKSLSTQFLVLGEYLFNIRELKLYEGQWQTFNEFCDEFKSLTQGSISKLANIYKKFVVEYGFTQEKLAAVGGWADIAEVMPVANTKEEAEEWIEKATSLSRSDLRKELAEKRTGVDMSTCDHSDNYTMRICRTCHDKVRVDDSKLQ